MTAVHCRNLPIGSNLISDCRKTFKDLQSELVHLSSDYDYRFLISGLILSLISTFLIFLNIKNEFNKILSNPEFFLVVLQPLIAFASSFVEEEKLIWNFLFSTILVILLYKKLGEKIQDKKAQVSLLLLLFLHRISSQIRPELIEIEKSDLQFEWVLNYLFIFIYLYFRFTIISSIILFLLLTTLHSGPIAVKVILFISYFSKPFQFPENWISVDGFLLIFFYFFLFFELIFSKTPDFITFWCLSLASVSNRFILLILMTNSRLLKMVKNHPITTYLLVATSFYATVS